MSLKLLVRDSCAPYDHATVHMAIQPLLISTIYQTMVEECYLQQALKAIIYSLKFKTNCNRNVY